MHERNGVNRTKAGYETAVERGEGHRTLMKQPVLQVYTVKGGGQKSVWMMYLSLLLNSRIRCNSHKGAKSTSCTTNVVWVLSVDVAYFLPGIM